MSETEKEIRLDNLNNVYPLEDLNLLNFDDILEADFIQSLLCYMKCEEFQFDEARQPKDPYVHILYQMKNFLHKRNFNAVKFLRDLKKHFDSTIYIEEAKWDVARLTFLACFLLKDSSDSATKPDFPSLFQEGLHFTKESMVKPTFIKGLVLSLNNILSKIEHYDDDWMIDTQDTPTKSFTTADPEGAEFRKSTVAFAIQEAYSNNVQTNEFHETSVEISPTKFTNEGLENSFDITQEDFLENMEGKYKPS